MKLNKLMIVLIAGLSMAAVGCEETEDTDQHYTNKLFISATNYTENVLFTAGEMETIESSIAVAIAKPEDYEITAKVEPAPELLSTYQMAYYDDTAIILPEEYYSMPETTATITAGSVSSPSLAIDFLNTGELDLNSTYILPVTVSSVEGIGLLESAMNYYYVLKGGIPHQCGLQHQRQQGLSGFQRRLQIQLSYPEHNGDSFQGHFIPEHASYADGN